MAGARYSHRLRARRARAQGGCSLQSRGRLEVVRFAHQRGVFQVKCVNVGRGERVSSAECDVSKWFPHTNDTFRAVQLALADEKVNGNASFFAAKQTRLGFNLLTRVGCCQIHIQTLIASIRGHGTGY